MSFLVNMLWVPAVFSNNIPPLILLSSLNYLALHFSFQFLCFTSSFCSPCLSFLYSPGVFFFINTFCKLKICVVFSHKILTMRINKLKCNLALMKYWWDNSFDSRSFLSSAQMHKYGDPITDQTYDNNSLLAKHDFWRQQPICFMLTVSLWFWKCAYIILNTNTLLYNEHAVILFIFLSMFSLDDVMCYIFLIDCLSGRLFYFSKHLYQVWMKTLYINWD